MKIGIRAGYGFRNSCKMHFGLVFGSGIAGKCMLDFLCYFPKTEISGLSLDF